MIERMGKSLSDGFDKRLFQRPALKKCRKAIWPGNLLQLFLFASGEKTSRDRLGIKILTNPFYVHADVTVIGDGEKGRISGMRNVERERSLPGTSQLWFSFIGVRKYDAARINVKIRSQHQS